MLNQDGKRWNLSLQVKEQLTGQAVVYFPHSFPEVGADSSSSTIQPHRRKVLNTIPGFCCDSILRFSMGSLHLICVPVKMP